MKLIVLVVLAIIACAVARPEGGHLQATAGYAAGVVAVPALGLGGNSKRNISKNLLPFNNITKLKQFQNCLLRIKLFILFFDFFLIIRWPSRTSYRRT